MEDGAGEETRTPVTGLEAQSPCHWTTPALTPPRSVENPFSPCGERATVHHRRHGPSPSLAERAARSYPKADTRQDLTV